MKNDHTHIAVILDRSGSMQSIRDDIIGGFNSFLEQQKAGPGRATLTLVQFDSQDPYEVIHKAKPIGEVPALTAETYSPRSTTPLLDALGRGINDLEATLAQADDKTRPSRVVMVIITDGMENASREFRKDQIEKMIKVKQEDQDWQFVFLSADLGAIGEAGQLNIPERRSMAYDKSGLGVSMAMRSLSDNLASYRASHTDDMSFSDSDRELQEVERGLKKKEAKKEEAS